jgi:hypothetical protein
LRARENAEWSAGCRICTRISGTGSARCQSGAAPWCEPYGRGMVAPKLGRSLVVKGEAPLGVAHVDRGRKCLNSLPRQTTDVASRHGPRAVPWRRALTLPLALWGFVGRRRPSHERPLPQRSRLVATARRRADATPSLPSSQRCGATTKLYDCRSQLIALANGREFYDFSIRHTQVL